VRDRDRELGASAGRSLSPARPGPRLRPGYRVNETVPLHIVIVTDRLTASLSPASLLPVRA
jgi:hypothetical protein